MHINCSFSPKGVPAMKETIQSEHGVFLQVFDTGLLIKGAAGMGKSTLALELIERGHRFISDDVVDFMIEKNVNPNQPIGKSPHMLKDLLAVRDLGVLNISDLFAANSCLQQHPLDLIIELVGDQRILATTLAARLSQTTILGQTIPIQAIHAHPKRNLSIIVEIAVKNYILYKQGQDANTLLKKRQQQDMQTIT